MVACATAVSVDILATCYHCLSSSIRSGPGIEEEKAHREAVVHLTNSSTGEKVQARIAIYSVENDVALLQTLNDAKLMDGKEIVLDDAYVGQPYYILGTPISDDEAPLQVISGRISAKFIRTLTKQTIHDLHGHGGARVGASGGAAFARHLDYGKAHFLGIVVSGPSISHDTKIGTFVSSNYVKMISSGTLYAIYMLFKNRDNVFKF
uniref:Uncharacterized protein n=1 Tax=Acrobeloides nanus TaxID=290746 RepID=A0A914C312_9BILA